nr:glucitol/sorbitol-specific PTS transporter subunit IIC [Ligilactobacillus salivarius]
MLESKADCQIAFILRNFVCDYYDLGEKLAIEEKQEITKLVRKYDKSKTVRNLIIRHLKILNFLHEHGRKISTTPDCYYELTSSEVNDEIISILKKYLHSEEITEAEKSFLLIPLNINYSNRNTERINKRLMWIDELFAEIFSQVKENISLDIDYNRVFEQIKYHSIFMINRSATYMRNDDLFSREIVEKYPVAVDLAIMTVNLLESKLHIKISDKELGYLALYYQMEIEDEKRGNPQYHKVAIVGEEKMDKIARGASKNIFTRYLILPFLSAFMLGNPMSFTMARFLPEYYKPSYYAAQAQFCHTSNGVFPHINPGELFVWMGIAQGVQKLGLNSMDLAIRYLLVGLVMNFIGGWVTDFTTAYVCRTTGIKLSKTVD